MSISHPLNQAVINQALQDLRNGQLRRCLAMGFAERDLDALKHPELVSMLVNARVPWCTVTVNREVLRRLLQQVRQVEQHDGLAVVDFWATWCGPCRMVAPVVDQLAQEYEGKARVLKLDVDSNQKTAMRFNIRSIPQILFFKIGKVVDTVVGAVPKSTLEAKFKQHAA